MGRVASGSPCSQDQACRWPGAGSTGLWGDPIGMWSSGRAREEAGAEERSSPGLGHCVKCQEKELAPTHLPTAMNSLLTMVY